MVVCHRAHPVETSRGMSPSGDAYSPGWFRIVLRRGATATLLVGLADELPVSAPPCTRAASASAAVSAADANDDALLGALARAAQAYLVQRGTGTTVIAGYPWFLDWGRDTLIAARGLISLGQHETVLALLTTFGRFESNGTLPNMIHGEDASNRDTSDASLWYGVVCEELAEVIGERAVYGRDVGGRTVRDVLAAIALGYWRGTPNGIHADQRSCLIWSPSHFTWMDTNHPAGTPREGYPVSIQALWIRLLRQLDLLGVAGPGPSWGVIAERATQALDRLFWLPDAGWLADVLIAPRGVGAIDAVADHALRSNAVLPVALGMVTGAKARAVVEATRRHLIVPGALRSLAPLPAHPPAPIRSADGRLLNDPDHPYWGRYEGDEDTRRKPAYHNGTAWVWTFPTFCEALASAWNWSPTAIATARAYLGSIDGLLHQGCLGQLPEICDGDAPHTQRGCDAQAWSVTESARVWKLLSRRPTA
jgi:starch synthase (maltosyl-transferring)